MSMTQILGAVALVAMEQVSEVLTGRYSSQTMWYLDPQHGRRVGGVLLIAFGRRRQMRPKTARKTHGARGA